MTNPRDRATSRHMASKPQLNPALKLVLDLGPLLIFFAANSRFGIFAATGAFMAAILIALAIAYVFGVMRTRAELRSANSFRR